jgi:hypothetical protein
LLIVTLALGACDSQQDKIAASRGLPPFDIRACVHEIRASTQIPPNGCLISPTGAYVLVMRPSGALDITAASQAAAGGKALWTTGSRSAKPDTALATFQSDGNLVVYDHQRPIWNTGSVGAIGDYDLKLSDIGNLTIANSAGKTVWSSGFSLAACATGLEAGSALPVGGCVASPSKTYALVMADAGSLDVAPVKPDGSLGAPIWTSGSRASAAHSASGAFQTDGNLVIYDQPGPRPIWNSMSNGPLGAYRLELSDAGEAEILDASGKTIWSSKTGRPGKA